jgi:hypothetical protein
MQRQQAAAGTIEAIMIHEAVPQKELEHRIIVRRPETIYRAEGLIENGSFHGRWHFSFDRYVDAGHERFGVLRVFNDDTLSPGAVWPLHPHHEIEVVTCCAAGEFRHADENGQGGMLKQGWVQHTTRSGATRSRAASSG